MEAAVGDASVAILEQHHVAKRHTVGASNNVNSVVCDDRRRDRRFEPSHAPVKQELLADRSKRQRCGIGVPRQVVVAWSAIVGERRRRVRITATPFQMAVLDAP